MTTLQQKEQFIREKCVAANPSIKSLVFGCFFRWKEIMADYEEDGYIAVFENWVEKNKSIRTIGPLGNQIIVTYDHVVEIIGREIRAEDILRVLPAMWMLKFDGNGNYNFVNMDGYGSKNWPNEYFVWVPGDLSKQSEFTKDKIYQLLQ